MRAVGRRRGRQRGFSLVELAVSLAVVGAAGLLVWRLVPAARGIADADPTKLQLETVQNAIEGFALARSRLPCPAALQDGQESCASGAAGFIPWRVLGLGPTYGAMRYGVYRAPTADLALLSNASRPNLPPLPVVPVATYDPATINGLDLCFNLRRAVANPAGLAAGGVAAAYAVAHPGANGRFEGQNAAGFDLPGRAATDSYDDRMVASGLAELSARLSCPKRLGEATAAARSAYAAYDLDRNAQMFLDFRNFAYQVRQTDRRFADANVAQATLDLAIATATIATSISVAANSAGIGAGLVVGSVLGGTAAVAGLAAAVVGKVQADAAELKAQRQSVGASALRTQSTLDLAAAVRTGYGQDLKGVLP